MSSFNDFPAKGKILAVQNGKAVFNPAGTNYELHLIPGDEPITTPSASPIHILIRAKARKIWTVPSGGNFITPLFGPPKIIQGRVLYADSRHLVLQAGAPIVLELPADDSAFDLANGPIALGAIVNATVQNGSVYQLPISAPAL